jgi:hypothetical protein
MRMIDDDLNHPPSPVKHVPGHTDDVVPELIFCPNQPVPDAELLVCIWVCHDLREHGVLVVRVAQYLR